MAKQRIIHATVGLTLGLVGFAACDVEPVDGSFAAAFGYDELVDENEDDTIIIADTPTEQAEPLGPSSLTTTPDEERPLSASINLALGQPTIQSSTAYGGDAARAVDGDTDGSWGNNSVNHTAPGQGENWWQVDLGGLQPIGEVVIYNRSDCCTHLLHDFDVMVSADGLTWESFHHAGLARPQTHVSIDRQARYVRVDNPDVLHMAEVEVLRTRNLAYGKPATQSSTGFGGDAGRAVDGNTDGNFGHGSVSHTAVDGPAQWWQVDLESVHSVGQVVLFNRTDCCAAKLHDFTVRVSNDGQNWEDIPFDGPAGSHVVVPVNRDTRFVQVENSDRYLHLAEVQVFEAPRLPGSSYGRGVGWIPSYGCAEGEQYDAGLCYEPCDPGYTNVLNLCYADCDPGYTDMGLTCTNWNTLHTYWKDVYDRGVGTLPIADCGQGNEYDAGLCYPECDLGYNGVGPVCWSEGITIESISTAACDVLRIPILSDIAGDAGAALTSGVGLGGALGVLTGSVELGVAYGADGEFGCYVSGCVGVSTEVEISAYAVLGTYLAFAEIAGDSLVAAVGAGVAMPIPDTPLSVSVGAALGLVTNLQLETIGGTLSASIGFGVDTPLDLSLSGLECHTEVLQTQ